MASAASTSMAANKVLFGPGDANGVESSMCFVATFISFPLLFMRRPKRTLGRNLAPYHSVGA